MQAFIYRWQLNGFGTQIQTPYVSSLISNVMLWLEPRCLQCMLILCVSVNYKLL